MVCKEGVDVWLRVRMCAVNMLPVQTAYYYIIIRLPKGKDIYTSTFIGITI